MAFDRIITIVLDSIGIGEAPDAAKYHDTGADTLGHIGDILPGNYRCLIYRQSVWAILTALRQLLGLSH